MISTDERIFCGGGGNLEKVRGKIGIHNFVGFLQREVEKNEFIMNESVEENKKKERKRGECDDR